jgi:hypothetical protein
MAFVQIFCSNGGAAHVNLVADYAPARHTATVDGSKFWISESMSVSEVAVQACAGKLKMVKPGRDERVSPGASSDAAPIAGGFVDGQADEGGDG